jgi:hypothetical protein
MVYLVNPLFITELWAATEATVYCEIWTVSILPAGYATCADGSVFEITHSHRLLHTQPPLLGLPLLQKHTTR